MMTFVFPKHRNKHKPGGHVVDQGTIYWPRLGLLADGPVVAHNMFVGLAEFTSLFFS